MHVAHRRRVVADAPLGHLVASRTTPLMRDPAITLHADHLRRRSRCWTPRYARPTRASCDRSTVPVFMRFALVGRQLRLERDLRAGQRARHRTGRLGLLGQAREGRRVDAVDRPVVCSSIRVIEQPASVCSRCTRAVVRRSAGGWPVAAQQIGERHREATGVPGTDQLLGVGAALPVLHTRAQGEGPLEGAAAQREAPAAVGHRAAPTRRRRADHPYGQDRLPSGVRRATPRVAPIAHRVVLSGPLSLALTAARAPAERYTGAERRASATEETHGRVDDRPHGGAPSLQFAPERVRVSRRAGRQPGARRVGDAVARCLREASANIGRPTRPADASGRSSPRPRPRRAAFLGCEPHEVIFGAEHDLARLHPLAHRGPRVRRRGRDPRLLAGPRRRRRPVARAGPRQGAAWSSTSSSARHPARLRRPAAKLSERTTRGRVRLGLERDRHDRRRAAGLRARPQRRRARLDRRRPLRGARADRRAGDRRRRPALLAVQVLRPAPRHGLRAHRAARVLAPLQGAARRRTAPLGRRFETGTQPYELLAGFNAAIDYLAEIGGMEAIVPYERALGQRFLDGLPERSPSTGCRRWRDGCRPSWSTSTARPRPRSRRAWASAASGSGRTTAGIR